MQYLLMIYSDEAMWSGLPAAQRKALHEEFGSYTQDIVKSGHFRAGNALEASKKATTVRKTGATDGPFAETKEQLGGYYLVECASLDEAVSLAKRIPSVKIGDAIEIRPIMPM